MRGRTQRRPSSRGPRVELYKGFRLLRDTHRRRTIWIIAKGDYIVVLDGMNLVTNRLKEAKAAVDYLVGDSSVYPQTVATHKPRF